ncbi:cet1p [Saccharomyces arboricola H-6]|uniref:mRNA-capping enzyme subunit beta n=1 Tax=Saccharomyces arboricola (strain H-6 / AS 2.3317 / CBS 10644) TaxID=1160507 RepID=J8Q1G3_SACAR|nr:cet1p [Saccharomyces arboricola H-6]
MSYTDNPPQTKRALSLDDLVNHDENEKVKLQKLNEAADAATSLVGNVEPDINQLSTGQPATIDNYKDKGDQGLGKKKSKSRKSSADDEETDTDDDVGASGEINFDSGMDFDYDKQHRNLSPGEVPLTDDANDAKVKSEDPSNNTNHVKTDEEREIPKQNNDVSAANNNTARIPLQGQKQHGEKPLGGAIKKEEEQNAAVNSIFEEKATLQSKKNNIKKDLEILSEISASSKPSKYKNVPIWAQKWKPTIKALQSIDVKDLKIDPSFLNIIPDDDLTKSVQDWVYATIYSIAPELRSFIELEMKFGIIIDAKGPDRVNPPVSSQCVFTELDAHLTPNIDSSLFNELSKYIRGISEVTENTGKFSIIESQTRDSVYRVGLSTQRPRFLRMSTDIKTGRVGQFIEKRHVAQLLLYSPKDSYDVKISLNLELPVPDNDPPEKYKSQSPISERTKDRISYIHNNSCTRIDITKVDNHNQGSKNRQSEITHEVELEINTPALLNAFDNITNDSKEYASLVRTFLNNGTIIRRKLSSLSYEIFEGSKKVM